MSFKEKLLLNKRTAKRIRDIFKMYRQSSPNDSKEATVQKVVQQASLILKTPVSVEMVEEAQSVYWGNVFKGDSEQARRVKERDRQRKLKEDSSNPRGGIPSVGDSGGISGATEPNVGGDKGEEKNGQDSSSEKEVDSSS